MNKITLILIVIANLFVWISIFYLGKQSGFREYERVFGLNYRQKIPKELPQEEEETIASCPTKVLLSRLKTGNISRDTGEKIVTELISRILKDH